MPATPDLHYAFGLEPEEALRYLAGKENVTSFNWYDIWQDAHAKAFTVAKAMQADVLNDIHTAVQDGMKKGLTVAQFRKTLEPTLQAKGWWGKKKMTDPQTGVEKVVQLGSPRRLELIYRTNISVAESAARYQDFVESAPERPYWQFVCVLDANTRPSHRRLNGKVFRWDDPFWNTFWPPLDWGCRCGVRKLTAEQVHRLGLKVESSSRDIEYNKPGGGLQKIGAQRSTYTDPVSKESVSTGAGWDYNPGQAWHLDADAWEKASSLPDPLHRQWLADMAKNNLARKVWPAWVDGILARKHATGFSAVVGWMKPELFDKLSAFDLKPQSPLIIANDKQIIHMQRPVKQKTAQALSLEEIKNLPRLLSNYEAVYYDTEKKNLLYVIRKWEKGASKVVVEVDYNLRGYADPVNLVKTASNIDAIHFGNKQYILVDGSLK